MLALGPVGVQTPAEQLSFLVLCVVIVIAACAVAANANVTAPVHNSVRAGICMSPPKFHQKLSGYPAGPRRPDDADDHDVTTAQRSDPVAAETVFGEKN